MGQVYQGLSLGHAGSEGEIIPIDDASALFENELNNSADSTTDEYGAGTAVLYALDLGGPVDASEPSALAAIMTAIIKQNAAPPFRQTVVTYWIFDQGDWQISHLLVGSQSQDLLSPSEYYKDFVLYPP